MIGQWQLAPRQPVVSLGTASSSGPWRPPTPPRAGPCGDRDIFFLEYGHSMRKARANFRTCRPGSSFLRWIPSASARYRGFCGRRPDGSARAHHFKAGLNASRAGKSQPVEAQ